VSSLGLNANMSAPGPARPERGATLPARGDLAARGSGRNHQGGTRWV